MFKRYCTYVIKKHDGLSGNLSVLGIPHRTQQLNQIDMYLSNKFRSQGKVQGCAYKLHN